MALLLSRLSIAVAVALAAAAQVVVSPASCCLLRAALFGGEACCHAKVKAEPAPRSCCHGRAAKPTAVPIASALPSGGGECLWCSAGPRVAANDRVVSPVQHVSPALSPVVAAEPVVAAPVSPRLVVKEPFRRTAIAACAWLCVWRK
jgi:hypothetical protein